MDHATESPSPPRSREPAILLKIIALAWFLGAAACLLQAIPSVPLPPLPEVSRTALIYLPLAIVSATVGFGLWGKRCWARTIALLIGWLALSLLIIGGLTDAGILTLLVFMYGLPTIGIVLVQAYLLTRPATKALFGLLIPRGPGAYCGDHVVGFGLAVGVGAGVSAGVVCSYIISTFPIIFDDWTVALPGMLAVFGLIDGAFYGYRRCRENTESAEQALAVHNDVLFAARGYVLWAILGIVAGGWVGVCRYGSFWGLLIGPAIAPGIRFVLFWLVTWMPSVVVSTTTSMHKIGGSDWGHSLKTAGVWIGVASVVTIPSAFFLHYYSHGMEPLVEEILVLCVLAISLLLPFASGLHHRSVKVAGATAIMGITIGGVVLAIIVYLSLAVPWGGR